MKNKISRVVYVKKNLSIGILYNILAIFLNFISRKLFIKYIGIEFLGINGLFANVLSLLSMADMGFGVAMNYTFYKPLAENNTIRLAELISFYRKIYLLIAGAITFIGIAMIPFLRLIINIERDIPYIYIYYLIFLLQTVVGYLFVYKINILSADQKNYKIDKINMAYALLRTIFQICLIILVKSYVTYILIGVLFTLLTNLHISHLANKEYPYIKNNVPLNQGLRNEIYYNLKSIFIYKVSATLMSSIDNIVMSVMLGTIIVGIYSNYCIAITSINSIISMFYGAITASVGNIIATEGKRERYAVFKSLQLISFFISTVVCIEYYFLINDFIKLWIGNEYLFNHIDILAISFDLYLGMLMRPLWTFRDATGLYIRTRYIMAIAAFLNIFFSIIFCNFIGVAGVILSSSLCRILTYVWYEPIILYREYFDGNLKKYFSSLITNTIITFMLLFIISQIDQFIKISSWAGWIGKGVLYFIILAMIYYICLKNKEEYLYIVQKLKKS